MINRINKGSGVYICSECGKRTRDTGHGEAALGICKNCYIEQEKENHEINTDNKPIDLTPYGTRRIEEIHKQRYLTGNHIQ